ncbi:MAG: hypothetical protein AB7K24_26380, partial [Gemmataceae bacterium]
MMMNAYTVICLVLLQLAIGWHFVFEAVSKFKKDDWTSKGYLSAAQGPFAPMFRKIAGAPELPPPPTLAEQDAILLASYELKPINPNDDLSKLRWHEYLPDPISKDWDAYYDRFIENYKLKKGQQQAAAEPAGRADEVALLGTSPTGFEAIAFLLVDDEQRPPAEPVTPELQGELARRKLIESKNAMARWLHDGKKKVTRPKVSGPNLDVNARISSGGQFELTTPERIQEYKRTRDLYLAKLNEGGFFAQDSPELKRLKTATETLRGELAADLVSKTDGMKDSLREVLNYEQRRMA